MEFYTKLLPKYNMENKYQIGYNKFNFTVSIPNSLNLKKQKKPTLALLLFVGALVGFINGLWGGGGGMVCVASLVHLLKLPEKKAHATTILIILPLCIASFIIYLYNGAFNFAECWPILVGFFSGGIVGAVILKKINNIILMIIFAVLIIAGGIKMIL